ncbi:PIG-L deacetylase family protein [Saxibacter everestensis]|uniref:PIG-L deacetylase family protein n=1 Tax=Saxibacter everestensis TaxID=2909229 RepID=A0ABY8QV18_9MICO|nr:PIG-L deacetylase family protein [Brevibacteriaceae bacterium ZFBP1038]
MVPLDAPHKQRVVVVAPHSDDECLGAGGTIAMLAGHGAEVTVVTIAADLPPLYPAGTKEKVEAEALRAHGVLGVHDSVFLDFPAVDLPQQSTAAINRGVQDVVDSVRPTMVFLPFPDRHVDHKIAFDAGMVASRPVRAGKNIALVALYETISETFWNAPGAEPNFVPSWTVDITETIDQKIAAFEQFESQISPFPGPRSAEALRALALFRGSQSSVGYGESFQIARATFSPVDLLSV